MNLHALVILRGTIRLWRRSSSSQVVVFGRRSCADIYPSGGGGKGVLISWVQRIPHGVGVVRRAGSSPGGEWFLTCWVIPGGSLGLDTMSSSLCQFLEEHEKDPET